MIRYSFVFLNLNVDGSSVCVLVNGIAENEAKARVMS
jgi:hypothetical protein